MLRRLGL